MKGPSKRLLSMAAKVRNFNPAQIYQWALLLYKEGYEEGLREGEHEYDDAVIMDIDEALERGMNLDGYDV